MTKYNCPLCGGIGTATDYEILIIDHQGPFLKCWKCEKVFPKELVESNELEEINVPIIEPIRGPDIQIPYIKKKPYINDEKWKKVRKYWYTNGTILRTTISDRSDDKSIPKDYEIDYSNPVKYSTSSQIKNVKDPKVYKKTQFLNSINY